MSDDFLTVVNDFTELGLAKPLLRALADLHFEEPTPIQARIIPHVLEGRDVVGQAQTGTGKTAAFALPLLHRLGMGGKGGGRAPRVLVLAPTRELALQVAEAFESYSTHIPNLNVLAVYGGEEYGSQLRGLRRGVDVLVGTPGRIMDHIRRGSLDLSGIETLVLDEADEMLRMGFIDDVEWIVSQAPEDRQVALFSATMPDSIRRIATTYLNDPVEITIANKTATAATIEQRFLLVNGMFDKKEALKKILETEAADGILIFVRTKMLTVEIAEFISDLGYKATALNGDIAQNQRQRNVDMLKEGKIDILVATDVAARGLDVERISHVINLDIPFDTESYIHRIGRTGRAGREGKAILFISHRERGMLRNIERATRQKIEPMELPTVAEINSKRLEKYKNRITEAAASDCTFYSNIVSEYCIENDMALKDVAAALAKMVQGDVPLFLEEVPEKPARNRRDRDRGARKSGNDRFKDRNDRFDDARSARPPRREKKSHPEEGMLRYRVEVGDVDGVKPGNIVGAIANEGDIDSKFIGRINIFDTYSTVDLPDGMPGDTEKILYKARVNGKLMKLRVESGARPSDERAEKPERSAGRKGGREKFAGHKEQKGGRKKSTAGKTERSTRSNNRKKRAGNAASAR